VKAQTVAGDKDSLEIALNLTKEVRSPKKASIYSALFPGLGQIYNKKYWKLPIIYGGFAGLIYGYSWNNNLYDEYFDAFRTISQYSSPDEMTEEDKEYLDDFINNPSIDLTNPSHFDYATTQFSGGKDFYRRNRDFTIIVMLGLHVLNIIDASVDAHLFDYDISDDLSMNIEPSPINISGSKQVMGMSVNFNF
jgi:TM2 domain-containing membrane protein YozV